jgi:hypothetical protein
VAALERHERLRVRGAEPVEVRAVLPPQVEQVLEAVATNAVRAPLRSSSAFVVTVVPCVNRSTSPAPTAAAAASTDSSCDRAVGTFAVGSSPLARSSTASVKVPPTSTPRTATDGLSQGRRGPWRGFVARGPNAGFVSPGSASPAARGGGMS